VPTDWTGQVSSVAPSCTISIPPRLYRAGWSGGMGTSRFAVAPFGSSSHDVPASDDLRRSTLIDDNARIGGELARQGAPDHEGTVGQGADGQGRLIAWDVPDLHL